jgi:hypothetical protein
MKRCFLFLSLIALASPGWSVITSAQLEQARQSANQLFQTVQQLQLFISQIKPLVDNGNAYEFNFSTNSVSLTAQQTADIVNYYNSLKAQLQAEYLQLP